jgi:hypothetical protein
LGSGAAADLIEVAERVWRGQGRQDEREAVVAWLIRMADERRRDAAHPFNRNLPATHFETGAATALRQAAAAIKQGDHRKEARGG